MRFNIIINLLKNNFKQRFLIVNSHGSYIYADFIAHYVKNKIYLFIILILSRLWAMT